MGFNKRKMEVQRAAAAAKEAAAKRASERQVLEDAGRLVSAWNEPGQAHADAVLADDRLRAQGAALVPRGALSGLPHDAGGRFADPRSPPLVRD